MGRILLGPLKPFYRDNRRVGFEYRGDSISPIRDKRGGKNVWLDPRKIVGAFRDEMGRYYVVYETENIDYYRRISTILPPDAEPVEEISIVKTSKVYKRRRDLEREGLELDDFLSEYRRRGYKCDIYYGEDWYDMGDAPEDLEWVSVECKKEEKIPLWRGKPYKRRDFIEDDSFSRKGIMRELEDIYGPLTSFTPIKHPKILGRLIGEKKGEEVEYEIYEGVLLTPPYPEINKDNPSIDGAGIIIVKKERRLPYNHYAIAKDKDRVVDTIMEYIDEIRDFLRQYNSTDIEIGPPLTNLLDRSERRKIIEMVKRYTLKTA